MVNQALDVIGSILPTLNLVLGVAGFFTTIYAMSLTSYEDEDRKDPKWVQWGQRISSAMIAMGIILLLKLQLDKGWYPWPPATALMFGVTIMMFMRIVAIKLRIRREGHHQSSTSYSRNNGLSRQKH